MPDSNTHPEPAVGDFIPFTPGRAQVVYAHNFNGNSRRIRILCVEPEVPGDRPRAPVENILWGATPEDQKLIDNANRALQKLQVSADTQDNKPVLEISLDGLDEETTSLALQIILAQYSIRYETLVNTKVVAGKITGSPGILTGHPDYPNGRDGAVIHEPELN